MYNLNVNLATGPGNHNLLALETNCTTPKTPEILNSLIAMSNPFDGYHQHKNGALRSQGARTHGTSESSSSGSPMGSPGTPPSVQHTCSQLIKEGLKLTIQTKRRHNGQDNGDYDDISNRHRPSKVMRRGGGGVSPHNSINNDDDDDDYDDLFSPGVGLTPEDEERRKRRRERNKVAATKCRLKKRERTVNLVQESEILENQNHDLKGQIQELETQRRRLMDMLSMHRPSCMKSQQPPPPQQQQHMSSHIQYNQDGQSSTSYPPSNYCNSNTLDTPTTSYNHYSVDSCNYNSAGYSNSGVDNGCMA